VVNKNLFDILKPKTPNNREYKPNIPNIMAKERPSSNNSSPRIAMTKSNIPKPIKALEKIIRNHLSFGLC
jgi:hypothetical protein